MSKRCCLYRYYDAAGNLLHVNCALGGTERLQKRFGFPWCDQIARIDVERFKDRIELDIAYREAIKASPVYIATRIIRPFNRGLRTHGLTHTRAYIAWRDMLRRCRNPNRPDFRNYGGRGITVCERWLNFPAFFQDMGQPPAGLSLDRINNDGNYEPGNCRWADSLTQANNRRRRA
jgi:hypothetical protein